MRLQPPRSQGLSVACGIGLFTLLVPFAAVQAAPTVFRGVDNSDVSNGAAHPTADAAAAAFATAAGSLLVNGFEGATVGGIPASLDFGAGVTASFSSAATNRARVSTGVGEFSTFPLDGTRYFEAVTLNNTAFFSMSFSAPLSALGFYTTDASDWSGSTGPIPGLVVELTTANGTVSFDLLDRADVSTVVNGNVAFFGIVDAGNLITGFSIRNPAGAPGEDALGVDSLQVATPVPLPATLPLALSALGGLAAWGGRYRRKPASQAR